MSRGFRIAVGIWLVIAAIAVGVEWASDDDPRPRARRERLPPEPREAAVAPPELERRAPEPPRPLRRSVREAETEVVETPYEEEETREVVERPERAAPYDVAAPATEPAPRATGTDAALGTRQPWDGDLGRASLKSPHLTERSRVTLGGGDLRDLEDTVQRDPPPPLGAASLSTGSLRDASRDQLGGGDLRGLERDGSLGDRSLGGSTLQDLSRGEDDRGDLADRGGRR